MKYIDFLKKIREDIVRLSEIDLDGDSRPDFRYHVFLLVGVGIEMLGATLDNHEWFKREESKNRFIKALDDFPSLKKYANYNLYKELRCGICHVYVPKSTIALNCKNEGGNNLDVIDCKVIIQMESFVKDFVDACQEVIDNIEKRKSSLSLGTKCFDDHLSIFESQ